MTGRNWTPKYQALSSPLTAGRGGKEISVVSLAVFLTTTSLAPSVWQKTWWLDGQRGWQSSTSQDSPHRVPPSQPERLSPGFATVWMWRPWMRSLCLAKLLPPWFGWTVEELIQEGQQTGLYGRKIVGLIPPLSEGCLGRGEWCKAVGRRNRVSACFACVVLGTAVRKGDKRLPDLILVPVWRMCVWITAVLLRSRVLIMTGKPQSLLLCRAIYLFLQNGLLALVAQ